MPVLSLFPCSFFFFFVKRHAARVRAAPLQCIRSMYTNAQAPVIIEKQEAIDIERVVTVINGKAGVARFASKMTMIIPTDKFTRNVI